MRAELDRNFAITKERIDEEVFRPNWRQMRYEAYWDGLFYRITRSRRWMNHVWLTGARKPPRRLN